MSNYQAVYDGVVASFGHAGHIAQHAVAEVVSVLTAPHVVMRPRLFVDGDQWCALLGENVQDGVAGFGASPAEASYDFDRKWGERLEPAAPKGGE
jgi:hypothetical protein